MKNKVRASVCVLAGLVVVNSFGFGGLVPASRAAVIFTGTEAVAPLAPQTGQATNVTVNVQAVNAASTGNIIDMEVHDASNQKVFQQFYENQNFNQGETKSYTASWIPTVLGAYTVNVGVFGPNWAGPYYWGVGTPVNVGAPAAVQTANALNAKFASTGISSPKNPRVGDLTNTTANVQNLGPASRGNIVDLEIQDVSGQKAYQQFWIDQAFDGNQTRSYTASWKPTVSGVYTMSVGVFDAGWVGPIYWGTPVSIAVSVSGGSAVGGAASGTVKSASVTVTPAAPIPAIQAAAVVQVQAQTQSAESTQSGTFYVDPNSPAGGYISEWQSSRPADAHRMQVIASEPSAFWFGGWNANVTQDANTLVTAAANAGAMPLLVAYNIPGRDCGGFSAGGANTASEYASWIQNLAQGIGSRPATVILEPDGLASMDCLSSGDQSTRLNLLSQAVHALKSLGKTKVYIDGGNANWISASAMASRLNQANIAEADGFAVNVSNFYTTSASESYGSAVSPLVGGKHFIVDTSRNGNGSTGDGEWCNPPGRALGSLPTTNTGNSLVDALLWVKRPGESDGACNGAPAAGNFWPDYALGLAAAAGY